MIARADYREPVGELHTRSGQRLVNFCALTYVHLWVLEGAVRKWIPGTGNVLYVLRDVLIIIFLVALLVSTVKAAHRAALWWGAALAIVLLASTQVVIGNVGVGVAAVGLRSYLAPSLLPLLVWVYGGRSLLPRLTRTVSFYLLIQALIVVPQVLSPASSWINREVESDAASFVNFGTVRASGTFSSPSGLSIFVPLAIAVTLCLIGSRTAARAPALPYAALIAGLLTAVVSGSRGALLAVGIVLAVFAVGSLATRDSGRTESRSPLLPVGLLLVGVAYGATTFLPGVIDSFASRFENAATSENAGERILEQMFGFLDWPVTLLGAGVGLHSQAGIAVGSSGGWIETESTRWVAELGVAGLVLVLAKLSLAAGLTLASLRWRSASPRLFLAVSAAFVPTLLWGQPSQTPTQQAATGVALSLLILAHRYAPPTLHPESDSETSRSRRHQFIRFTP